MNTNRSFLLAAAVAAILPTVPAKAQVLEEIIVTAQKREQSLQDVPISISAVSAEALEQNSIQNIYNLQAVVPGLTLQAVDPPGQGTAIALRGLGNSVFNMGFEPAVATFVDGIYRSRSGLLATSDFLDLERIEVLKGPQGTLFGKNTSAGLMHLISRKPTLGQFEGNVEVGYEEYGRYRLKGSVNLPVGDTAAFRLAASQAQGGGWLKVAGTGQDIHDRDRWAVKAQFLAQPSDDLSIHLVADIGEADEVCCAPLRNRNDPNTVALNGPLATDNGMYIVDPPDLDGLVVESNLPPRFQAEDRGVSLEVNWNIGGLTVTSLTGYRDYQDSNIKDNDFTAADMLRSNQGLPEVSLFSEELRLAGSSDLGAGRSLTWVVGGFISDETIKLENDFIWGPQIGNLMFFGGLIVPGTAFEHDFEQDIKSTAVFGQVDYDISDRLSLTVGARWSRDEKDGSLVSAYPVANNFGLPNSLPLAVVYDYDTSYESDEPTYMASLQYAFSDEVKAYLTYSRGYKSGGISMTRDAAGSAIFFGSPVAGCPPGSIALGGPLCAGSPTDPTFDEETADNIELGLKSELLDGRMRLNLAAWNTSFDGLQLQTLRADGSFAVSNVKGATSRGIELESSVALSESLSATVALQYLDATFDKGIPALTSAPGFLPLGGQNLPFSSEWTGNVGLNYSREMGNGWNWVWDVNAYFRTEYYNFSEPVVDRVQGGYTLYNGRVGFSSDNWDVYAWCRNCTDKRYTWSNFQIPFDGMILGHSTRWSHVAEPKMWGLTISRRF
ncbi:MAG: TonB-dependent receptor [Steroidobacteraceae bacterium]